MQSEKGVVGSIDADVHNFGRRCYRQGRLMVKPRNVLAEYLFLGKTSVFRQELNGLYRRISEGEELLPGIDFLPIPDLAPTLAESRMEYLDLLPLERRLTLGECHRIGAMLALMIWGGLIDAHRTNLAFGLSGEQMIFTPLDWETCFSSMEHPLASSLFQCHHPDRPGVMAWTHYGLSLLPALDIEQLRALLEGHLAMRLELQTHKQELHNLLMELGVEHIVRRLLLRPSLFYLDPQGAFLDAESLQLRRGDVPYFFQIGQARRAYMWSDEDCYSTVALPSELSINWYADPEYGQERCDEVVRLLARNLAAPSKAKQCSRGGVVTVLSKSSAIVVILPDRILSVGRKA